MKDKMTKQEEIREGIDRILRATQLDRTVPYVARVQQLLHHLHSQGVVIRAKCPDCEWSQFKDEIAGMTPCYSCNSTGYVIEPLIKKGTDESLQKSIKEKDE